MNNIYSLISIDAASAQDAVLKLSKMMRYLLYESENKDLKLSKEIEFLQNYIDLMRLRLNQKVQLTVQFPDTYVDFTLPPLLFIPFVENAFKHGISSREASRIVILLNIHQNRLHFQCLNTDHAESQNREASGLGLENIRKRLALLYGDSCSLTIETVDREFRVDVSIPIVTYSQS